MEPWLFAVIVVGVLAAIAIIAYMVWSNPVEEEPTDNIVPSPQNYSVAHYANKDNRCCKVEPQKRSTPRPNKIDADNDIVPDLLTTMVLADAIDHRSYEDIPAHHEAVPIICHSTTPVTAEYQDPIADRGYEAAVHSHDSHSSSYDGGYSSSHDSGGGYDSGDSGGSDCGGCDCGGD